MCTKKTPLTLKLTGPEIKNLRRKLGLNQEAFWPPLGVTQSAGSRYEAGQNIPTPTLILIHLIYLSQKPLDGLKVHKRAWSLVE